MKIRKTLCYLLSVMLLACIPWSAAFAAAPDATEPVDVWSGQHLTYGDITVTEHDHAARIWAQSPEGDDLDASLKAASVSLTNTNSNNADPRALLIKGTSGFGKASADITGNVSANTICAGSQGQRVIAVDSRYASVKVGGSVSSICTNKSLVAYGIDSNDSDIQVTGGVTVESQFSVKLINVCGGNLTVGGDATATGSNAEGVTVDGDFPDDKTSATIGGSISVQGGYAEGLFVGNGQNTISIKKDITATSTGNGEYDYAAGIYAIVYGGSSSVDVAGDIIANAANEKAYGIRIAPPFDGDSTATGKHTIQVHGNLVSNGQGIVGIPYGADILVENTIQADKVGVVNLVPPENDDTSRYGLTVWKIMLNGDGNAAEYVLDPRFLPDGIAPDGVVSHGPDKEMEKQIKYIVKVEQPAKGGTLSAVSADGKALPKSFKFPVAHEGEKVVLKSKLDSGWEIKAAYNGEGSDKQKLSKDADGNYYLIVPKGGGIDLSADLEKKTTPVKPTPVKPDPVKPAPAKVSGALFTKMVAKEKTGMTVSWTGVKGVKGYDIFFCRCDGKEDNSNLKKVATVKAGKKLQWSKTGLKKHRAYKAIVKAFVYKNGKKKYVRTSPMAHAYTSGSTKRFTNAKAVTLKKTSVTLKKGEVFQIKAGVTKLNPKKKLMNKGHAPYLRYLSTNKKIAAVSKTGKVKAKAKGTCKVYVYAHNGVCKKVKVTVK